MAAENENIPMVVDGDVGEEDYTADAAAEALEEAFEAGDFPTVAEMAALRATVTPRIDTRVSQAFGSLVSPPAAPSCANSPSVSYNAESVSLAPVVSSSHPVVGVDVVADSLRAALAVAVDGSSLHSSLTAALNLHTLSIIEKGKAAASVSRAEERVAKALRRRLVSSSDDDDEMNDTPAEAAKRSLIRRRKNARLIEKKKLDSEAKDSVMAPSDSLPANRRLSNHHDFLSVLIFLMDLEELVVRKEWGSAVKMWVFRQFEKGTKAHTAFNVHLKSGQGLQLNSDAKCYFRSFSHFREVIIGLFFTKLKDPIAVIEKSLKRIKLSLTGPDGPTTPTSLEGFCNTLRFLFNQAPVDAPYPERQQVSRIRERLPKQVEAYLLEWEVNNNQVINRYDVLMPCLHRQDVLFADSIESKGTPNPSNKRPAFILRHPFKLRR
jgi:hypothetical protein